MTTYSVSDSVKSTGSEDLKTEPQISDKSGIDDDSLFAYVSSRMTGAETLIWKINSYERIHIAGKSLNRFVPSYSVLTLDDFSTEP